MSFKNNILVQIIIALIFALGFLFIFSSIVPFNMDEFLQYHAFSCQHYPLNKYNIFREACGLYDLAPIGQAFLPLRSYEYVGSVTALFYYPLFQLWPSPYSARFLGIIFLMLQALILRRHFKVNFLWTFIGLMLFMPYAFLHVADSGQVVFQTSSIFFIYFFMRKWMSSLEQKNNQGWIYPLLLGIVIFFGVWVKLTYVFMLPAIAGIMMYYFFEHRNVIVKRKTNFLIGTAILLASTGGLCFLLANSLSRMGFRYYQLIQHSPKINIFDFSGFAENFSARIGQYLIDPLTAAHYFFEGTFLSVSALRTILMIIIGLLFLYGLWKIHSQKIKVRFVFFNIALFIVTLLIMGMSAKTWAMHHVIFSFPFLIWAAFYIISHIQSKRFVAALLGALFVLNVNIYYTLTTLDYWEKDRNHPALYRFGQFLDERYQGTHMYAVLDWGFYYIKTLYGVKDQGVIYIEPFNSTMLVERLKQVLAMAHRKPIFIIKEDNVQGLALMKTYFPNVKHVETDFDTGMWQAWVID